MSQSKKISHVYNPDNQTRQELLDNFVVRLPVFEKLFRAVKESRMDTVEQHFLIQGQRGTGKTTLLLKLAYEIENDPGLAGWMIPVRLNEEQYSIFSLCRLWERVAEHLEDRPGFADLPDIFAQSFEDRDYPENCFRILEKRLQREGRKLVLLIDNIVDVLRKIGEKDCRKLRDILHTTTEIRIIAASARTLEHSFSYQQPFFEFFKVIYLEGLNRQETEALLLNLAKNYQAPQVREIIEKYPARVETLRRLTGGVPRTIILLFEIFVDDSANVFEDLELILDRITPLYKHRMDELSGQQQAIMDAIAMHWDAVATGELAAKLRMDSKAVAAQLKILEKSSLIHSIPADRKNKLYLITERFFNIWYLMRYGRKKSREQVKFLVRFLEEWCSPEELAERITRHMSLARESALHVKGAYYMCEALAQCAPSSELQHELINTTREYLTKGCPELAESLSPSDVEILSQFIALVEKKDTIGAVKKIEELRHQSVIMWNVFGMFYLQYLEDLYSAEKYFRMGIEKGNTSAMNNLAGLFWRKRKDINMAEKYYRMAVDKGNTSAMFNLAKLLWEERKDLDGAEKYYRLAMMKGDGDAMNNLATLFWEERNKVDTAEKYYRLAVEKGNTNAMNNLAYLFWKERNDPVAAEKYYQMAVEKGNKGAINNLASFYKSERKDIGLAEKYYRMAVEEGNPNAMNALAWFFFSQNKEKEEALQLAEKSVELLENIENIHTLAVCLLWHDRYDESVQRFRQYLEFEGSERIESENTLYLIFLLAKKQHHLLYALFKEEHHWLRDRFKPVYYALMQRMRNEYPKEYKKMGDELRQTVEEVLAEADRMAREYA